MLREQKHKFVEEMRGEMERSQGCLFLDFTGLTVNEANVLRTKFREADVGFRVVKNTLMGRALRDTPAEDAIEFLKGSPTGVAICYTDPVTPAKVVFEFKKTCKHIRIKGAVVDQKGVGPEGAEALSKMASREETLGLVVAQFMSPAGNLIAQLKSPAGRIVGALDAKADEEASE